MPVSIYVFLKLLVLLTVMLNFINLINSDSLFIVLFIDCQQKEIFLKFYRVYIQLNFNRFFVHIYLYLGMARNFRLSFLISDIINPIWPREIQGILMQYNTHGDIASPLVCVLSIIVKWILPRVKSACYHCRVSTVSDIFLIKMLNIIVYHNINTNNSKIILLMRETTTMLNVNDDGNEHSRVVSTFVLAFLLFLFRIRRFFLR